jgi:REP element-mobilizing transposase RayT
VSEYLHKNHNAKVLIYHLVLPAKYRRALFDEAVDGVIKDVCLDIEKRYQMKFMEIGTDKNRVHLLIQSVLTYSVTKIVTMLKSLTAQEVFKRCPVVNGGENIDLEKLAKGYNGVFRASHNVRIHPIVKY